MGKGGGVAFSKHDRPWGTKENWQVLYGLMHMDGIVVITGTTKYYQCIVSYEGHNGSMNLCWMQQLFQNFLFQDVKTTINPKYEDAVWNMVMTKWKQEFFLFILNCFPIIYNNMRLPFLFIVFRSSAISLLFSGKSIIKNWNEQGR